MEAAHVVLLLAIAGGGVALGRRIGLPPIVAYVLGGMAVGPHALGWIRHSEVVEHLAELGVALLLFGIGIELSLDLLGRGLGRLVAAGGVQIAATVVVGMGAAQAAGWDGPAAAAAGMMTALSSTAIVFRLYQERGMLDVPPARAAAGILLVQDLALVPMVLLVPVLQRPEDGLAWPVLAALGEAGAALAVLVVLARIVLPRLLEQVARAGAPELFPITALVIAFGAALGAVWLGLSLPVGAFLAGLALSGSPYAQQVFAELLPLRDAFVAVFFTSIGMLLDPTALWQAPGTIALLLAIVASKGLLIAILVGVLWRSVGTGVRAGFALMQLGELAFVLVGQTLAAGVLSREQGQAVLAAGVLTMLVTPALLRAGELLAGAGAERDRAPDRARSGHVLVVGVGQTGGAITRVLRETGVPYVGIDAEHAVADRARREGLHVHFGDATRRGVLDELGVAAAHVAVVAVSDGTTARRVVSLLRRENPGLRILVRARRVEEIAEFERLGANEVIPSEFETSIELFVRVLGHLGVPRHVVRLQESILRAEHYRALRGFGTTVTALEQVARVIAAGVLETALVQAGSAVVGRTLGELALRERAGVNVLTVVRADRPLPPPGPETRLEADDLVVLHGPHEGIGTALALFEAPHAT